MNYREFFIVDRYSYRTDKKLDVTDKRPFEADKRYAEQIKVMDTAYLCVTLPVHIGSYYDKPSTMLMDDYQANIAPLKPKTTYMSMTFFRVKSYVPMSKTIGFFSAPKCIIPSLRLETLDGREIEAYSEYIKDGSQFVVLSDAMLSEVKKNFVHPKLSLENFSSYSSRYDNDGETKYTYFRSEIFTKKQAAMWYSAWKDGKESLRNHFQRLFDGEQRRHAAARRQKAEIDRNISQFEKDFGGW